MARRLSKSKLVSARQCLKRLHLEAHRPELATQDPATAARFAVGHAVGALARARYGGQAGVLIPWEAGAAHALRKSARLLAARPAVPLFEATVQHGGVLVRCDVLLPDGDGWRLVEVKSATRVKDEYAFDCAVQQWVLAGAGVPLTRVALAHVDNEFVYRGDGNYAGLFREVDLSEATAELVPTIAADARRARAALGPDEPRVAVGAQCFAPYACPFVAHCWPSGSDYPLFGIPRADKARLGRLVAAGYRDVREVPAEELNDAQRRVQRVAQAGRAERLPHAASRLAGLPYPRYYLDFETVAPAIPLFAGTRPYEPLPFQWSCHYEARAGELLHADFIDLGGEAPMRRVAESLIRVLGRSGPVFMYSPYERRIVRALAARYPELAAALEAIAARLVDLQPLTRRSYYHPRMHGSWSLKAVLPTIAAGMDYAELDEIQSGTDASEGYLEAIDPATPAPRKADLETRLLAYCRRDTAALVRLAAFLGSTPPA